MNPNNEKLAIIVLGNQKAGKSNTWYEFFGRKIRTGWKKIKIKEEKAIAFVRNSSFEETGDQISEYVFVRNSSFEERGDDPEGFFDNDILPKIVFCSVQYTEKGIRTIEWFKTKGYFLYIQWLNPGYNDNKTYDDKLGFETKFKAYGQFLKENGKEKENRTQVIKEFVYNWVRDSELKSNKTKT